MEITMSIDPIKLSSRESEVCNLLLTGNSTTKIAEVLKIKCNTVSTIKKSIFYKTKTNNLIELYEIYIKISR
jgi:DNA-binding NarL/FixJ family response regulator